MKKINILVVLILFLSSLSVFPQETQESQESQESQETQEAAETQESQQIQPELQEPPESTETTEPTETQPAKTPDPGFTIGNIQFTRPFVHAKKDFEQGIYYITLTEKEGVPYFNVFNQQKELLFEEIAVVIPLHKMFKRSKPKVEKCFINNYEYFRLKVINPGQQVMAYFLVKTAEKETPPPPESTESTGNKN